MRSFHVEAGPSTTVTTQKTSLGLKVFAGVLVLGVAAWLWGTFNPAPTTPLANSPPAVTMPAYTVRGHQGIMYFVVVSPAVAGQDDQLWRIADALSARKEDRARNGTVQVLYWTDASSAPTQLPMTDPQMIAASAQVNINTTNGLKKLIRDPFPRGSR
jgi:hypothetical protein